MQQPGVGRMAIYKTAMGDRPMIITVVWSDSCINGRVILEPGDSIHSGMRVGPDIHVSSAPRGPNVGEWRFYDDKN